MPGMEDAERETEEPKDHVTRRSGFKLRDKGALYLELNEVRVWAYRPSPPRVWTILKDEPNAKWSALRDPPLLIGPLLREMRIEDALVAGTLALCDVPVALRPKKRPFHVRRRQNLRRFFEHVPQAVQDETARGFCEGTWPLFRFLQSTPAALSLCASEDGARIAWVLANAHIFLAPDPRDGQRRKRTNTLAFARRWMTKKRKHILGRLGFPPTAASVTALSKVPRHHLSSTTIGDLLNVLKHPYRRAAAAHLPRLSAGLLAFLSAPDDVFLRVHHDFLVELSACDTVGLFGVEHLLRDTIALAAQVDASLPLFASRAQLREVHDALSDKAGKLVQLSSVALPLFPVPLTRAENEVLVPLGTTDALVAEGQGMHHCLGTLHFHHTLAAAGRFYCFAVTGPVRSTLAFVRHDGSAWSVYDFKGFANAPVPSEMHALAEGLLRRLLVAARAAARAACAAARAVTTVTTVTA